MLGLSNTAGYAIMALGCMEEGNGTWVLSRNIAERTGVSSTYLSKILHGLVRSGLITAKRGYRGGFKLSRSAAKINLMEVVEAAEGRAWAPRCLLGLAECSDERGCPAHQFWKPVRSRIEAKLRRLTLAQVAEFELTFHLVDSQIERAAPQRGRGNERRAAEGGPAKAARGSRSAAATRRSRN